MKNFNRNPFFYIILLAVVYLSFQILRPFIATIILAFMTTVFFKGVYMKFYKKNKSEKKTALYSTLVVLLFILIPAIFISIFTYKQVLLVNQDIQNLSANSVQTFDLTYVVDRVNMIAERIPGVASDLTEDELTKTAVDRFKEAGSKVAGSLLSAGINSIDIIVQFFIYIILLYFLFPIQRNFMSYVEKLSPLEDKLDKIYIERVLAMSKAMIKGTFLIATAQAILSGVFLWMAGVPYVLFLIMIMVVIGIIPIIGTAVVIFPVAIYMILLGDIGWGIFLIATNVVLTTNIDNVLRPMLVPKEAEMSPALVLLGVIGGLRFFGPMGFLYGPVIMILLVTSIQLYMNSGNSLNPDDIQLAAPSKDGVKKEKRKGKA